MLLLLCWWSVVVCLCSSGFVCCGLLHVCSSTMFSALAGALIGLLFRAAIIWVPSFAWFQPVEQWPVGSDSGAKQDNRSAIVISDAVRCQMLSNSAQALHSHPQQQHHHYHIISHDKGKKSNTKRRFKRNTVSRFYAARDHSPTIKLHLWQLWLWFVAAAVWCLVLVVCCR